MQQSRSFCFQNIVVEISVAIEFDETILFTIPRICHARVSKKIVVEERKFVFALKSLFYRRKQIFYVERVMNKAAITTDRKILYVGLQAKFDGGTIKAAFN